jgi:hypothetical protein
LAFFVGVAAVFSRLTIRVDAKAVEWHFGFGFLRRRILVRSIVRSAVVRNSWVAGWGYRFTGRGMLYNVAGLDAVEMTTDGGDHISVGTDRPGALISAIEEAARLQRRS